MKYRVELPSVSVPDDWTQYSRKVTIKTESASSNSTQVLFDENVEGSDNFIKDFDVEKGVDVVITVDVKDGNPETFKHTAGYFSLKEFNNFKVYRTDAPEPEPVIEPEPVVEPDPEPDEPDSIDDPQWGF